MSVILRFGNVSDQSFRQIQDSHFVFSNFIFSENRAVFEIMCENIVEPGRQQMPIQNGACALHAGYLVLQIHTQII